MLITLPTIDEPFCVTEHFCGDHRVNLCHRHFEILKHGHYKAFVLMDRFQMETLRQHFEVLYGGEILSGNVMDYNQCWQHWVDTNFNGGVIKANVTIATSTGGRYNGNYLYGFTDPDDALMFKLKWI
jgi:hypothetical protein